jgi:guanosine-3',5'-bis(diphosphate) 3'-pyrophosphohydrolase
MVEEARLVAARAHDGQTRKANRMPYFDHVRAVAELLADAGFGDDVVAAALLHDVVEHSEMAEADVRARFGDRIGDLVAAMTDRAELEGWEDRKNEHRERVRDAGTDAAVIYAADKVVGIREARAGYAEMEEAVEGRLGVPLDLRDRTWERDLAMLRSFSPPVPLSDELEDELERLRADRARSPSWT